MTRDDTTTLTPTVIKVILLGPLAAPPAAQLSAAEATMIGWLLRTGPAAFAEVWTEHEEFLRAEARRLNITMPANYPREFFSEGIARRLAHARARRLVETSQRAMAFHEAGHATIASAARSIPRAIVWL